jgi:simple sugar transport system substrate-binding protein
LRPAHLGSAVIDWTPYYTKVVEDTLAGKWQTGNFWWGGRRHRPEEDRRRRAPGHQGQGEKARAGLKDGSFAVWTGPVKDNTGKSWAPARWRTTSSCTGINFWWRAWRARCPAPKASSPATRLTTFRRVFVFII